MMKAMNRCTMIISKIVDGPRTARAQVTSVNLNSHWSVQQKHVEVVAICDNISIISGSHDSEEKYFEPVGSHDIEEKLDVIETKKNPLAIENKIAHASNKYKALEKIYHKQYNEKVNDLEQSYKKVRNTQLTDALSLEVQIDVESDTQKKNVKNHFIMSKMQNSVADIKRDILFPNAKRNKVHDYKNFFSE
eukprot:478377_1